MRVPTAKFRDAGRMRFLKWFVGVLAVLLVVIHVGGGWYLSNLVISNMEVDRGPTEYGLKVTKADGKQLTTRGEADYGSSVGAASRVSLASADGAFLHGEVPTATTKDTATRAYHAVSGTVAAGDALSSGWAYYRDPADAGLSAKDVTYETDLGSAPAWFVPGTSKTWLIFTHGRGAHRDEGLRIARIAHRLGYPVLLITYRDDPEAPPEDGIGNFGETEWTDLEDAVTYATDHGAEHVVLTGGSMGGAITASFLRNSRLADDPGLVSAVVMDSPATDFAQTVHHNARLMGYPEQYMGSIIWAAMRITHWRTGFDSNQTNYTPEAGTWPKTLVFSGTADTTVPPASHVDLKEVGGEQIQLEVFKGAEHVAEWNRDSARYERVLTAFLERYN